MVKGVGCQSRLSATPSHFLARRAPRAAPPASETGPLLGGDVPDVALDRLLAHIKLPRNLLVRLAPRPAVPGHQSRARSASWGDSRARTSYRSRAQARGHRSPGQRQSDHLGGPGANGSTRTHQVSGRASRRRLGSEVVSPARSDAPPDAVGVPYRRRACDSTAPPVAGGWPPPYAPLLAPPPRCPLEDHPRFSNVDNSLTRRAWPGVRGRSCSAKDTKTAGVG